MVSDDLHSTVLLRGLKLVLLTHLHQCLHASLVWLRSSAESRRNSRNSFVKNCCGISALQDFCRIWGYHTRHSGLLFIVGHTTGF